ncbi:tRNA cyclic N6-threonylcarbamoyladenosine(37) synthase TcdA [Alteromonas sediminis]|uniref:tRNA threonylcarbamoyladenosine dehydratase n=1 Tax=Alteromonas sediminis TaxID=2259342 RepID=A0A3N5Y2Q5_9ALTE|nr:tRNA cyclic N6-threonylcarbamoyladenosine(37) synthase TcdA [Alteromonas sediminis]RPJ67600.1 tRNA cyclic N6-threonylcarbamoyladenosine(37) synthase TcdA [Alteromonas sediminis]
MNNTVKTRFGGIARLYGNAVLSRFAESHVAIIGIGGVGCWSAEAIARSGVGKITLVDLDDICITNTNRQLHALSHTVGKAKVDVMKQRILAINPDCQVNAIEDFVLPENVSALITSDLDSVIEATDSVNAKAAIIAHCKRQKIHVVTVGGAGGQLDPTQITTADLAKTKQDPLAAKLRSVLRRDYGFSKNLQRRFGVPCVYSHEQLRYPQPDGSVSFEKSVMDGSTRLDCASGFGAISTVTATFGMVAASVSLSRLETLSRQASES